MTDDTHTLADYEDDRPPRWDREWVMRQERAPNARWLK